MTILPQHASRLMSDRDDPPEDRPLTRPNLRDVCNFCIGALIAYFALGW